MKTWETLALCCSIPERDNGNLCLKIHLTKDAKCGCKKCKQPEPKEVETPIADAMRERNEQYRKRMQELADQVQKNAQAEYDALIAQSKQPEQKECKHEWYDTAIQQCKDLGISTVYASRSIGLNFKCAKCGKQDYRFNIKPQPDTITIDGCEYTANKFHEAMALYQFNVPAINSPEGCLEFFKSALQKVSDKGEV